MVKLFSKKPPRESIHTLDEQEIQRRLYGKYHRDTPSKPKAQNRTAAFGIKTEIVNHSKSILPAQELKSTPSAEPAKFTQLFQRFPWKFAAILMAALFTTIILLQLMSLWFSKIRVIFPDSRVKKTFKSFSAAVEMRRELKKPETTPITADLQPIPQALSGGVSSDIPSQISTAKQRYYAVQVCTYQREEDAAKLVAELKGVNFPAFFRRKPASQQGGPTHYEVFVSKDSSYEVAKMHLNEFRKAKQFEKFSDSFIRSL